MPQGKLGMKDRLATVQQFRQRAAETRKLALSLDDPKNRAILEKAAEGYDSMAKVLQDLAVGELPALAVNRVIQRAKA
jgi:hypothetical protein